LQRSDFPLVNEDNYHPSLTIYTTGIYLSPLIAKSRIKYLFKRADYGEISKTLINQDWSFISEIIDIDLVVNKFYSILKLVIKQFVPKTYIRSSDSYPVWYSRALVSLIKEQARLHKN
jgi:hypothetical protein